MKSQITVCNPAGPFKPFFSIHQQLSVILIGSSEEGSDGQTRARSRSLPQRQQQQSCVLLPTSHHLLLLSCPPPTASCRPSSLLCLQPIKSGHHLMEEMYCLKAPVCSITVCLAIVKTSRKDKEVQHTKTCHQKKPLHLRASL